MVKQQDTIGRIRETLIHQLPHITRTKIERETDERSKFIVG